MPTGVVLITLYRPGKHNTFSDNMTVGLENAFTLLSLDPRIKCVVVTGHGSMFCAGADLDGGRGFDYDHDTPLGHRDGGGKVALAVHRCTKSVIAAINGSAVGVGITMTLPMNIGIVSEEAKIGFVFARRGIIMEAASSFFLPKLIGLSKAMHLITTGSVYPASHHLFKELFSEVVPPKKVLQRAIELAEDVATNTSAVSTHLMKDLMWRARGSAEATHLLDSKILLDVLPQRISKRGWTAFCRRGGPSSRTT